MAVEVGDGHLTAADERSDAGQQLDEGCESKSCAFISRICDAKIEAGFCATRLIISAVLHLLRAIETVRQRAVKNRER